MSDDDEPKPKDYDIDDGIDRGDEFENFEREQVELKQRKQQQKENSQVQNQVKAQKESANQYKNRDTVLVWGPTLITAPLVPAFLALISIVVGTTVIQWHYISTGPCLMLQAYVVGHVAVCYMFLAVYMALLIGPQCCARACGTTTLLFVYWIVFSIIFLGLNVFGIFVVVESQYCFVDYASALARTDDTAALYVCGVAFVVTFWAAFVFLAQYPFYYCYWRNKWKKKTNKVLDGLKFGKKTIDYSGYKSMRDEALESSDESEDDETVKKRQEKQAAFQEFEEKHGGAIDENDEEESPIEAKQQSVPAAPVAGPASPALQQSQVEEQPAVAATSTPTAQSEQIAPLTADGEPDYNQGYYDADGNWVYYTPEEIAAYEAQQAGL